MASNENETRRNLEKLRSKERTRIVRTSCNTVTDDLKFKLGPERVQPLFTIGLLWEMYPEKESMS